VSRPERPCRICGLGIRAEVTVTAHRRRNAREWRVEVCRDCWRVFEAMLDQGSYATQTSLTGALAGHGEVWFL
jgi:hypothetical protein